MCGSPGVNIGARDVPQTSDRFFSDFTTDERRVLYEYVVSQTKGALPQLKEFNLSMKPEGQSAPKSRGELMAAERDAKRRRVRHRSAKVHTKSKKYSEVLREVIKSQMVAYEDWIGEHYGDSGSVEAVQPEGKTTEEVKQGKQEMFWLDWDFNSNPHIRWKYILEKEKRRMERKNDSERSEKISIGTKEKEKDNHDRSRKREESRSRKIHHRDDIKKIRPEDRYKRDKHEVARRSENDQARKRYNYDNERSRTESHTKAAHSRHKGDRYEDYVKSNRDEENVKNDRCKRFRTEYISESKYKERYKDCKRGLDNYRHERIRESSRSSDKYGCNYETSHNVRIKEENNYSKGYHVDESYDSVKCKKEDDTEDCESDTENESSHSSDSKDAKRVKKLKKSKKKHKHKKKHKKEHKSEKSAHH